MESASGLLFSLLLFHFISIAFPPPSYHFYSFLSSSSYHFLFFPSSSSFLLFSSSFSFLFSRRRRRRLLLLFLHIFLLILYSNVSSPHFLFSLLVSTIFSLPNLLFSLHHHHHISIVFPPPSHFITFSATHTRQVIWKVRRPKPGQKNQKENKKGLPGNILLKVVVRYVSYVDD